MGSRSEQQRNMKSFTEHLVYLVPTCAHLAATTWTATINTKQKNKNCKRKIECPKPNTFGLPHFAGKHPLSDHRFISSHGDFFFGKIAGWNSSGREDIALAISPPPVKALTTKWISKPMDQWTTRTFLAKQCIFREKPYYISNFHTYTVRCDIFLCLLSPVGKRSAAVNVVVSLHLPIDIESTAKWSAPSSMSRSTTWCILKTWDHGSWPTKCMPGRNCTKCTISRCDLESCQVCLRRGMETIKLNP